MKKKTTNSGIKSVISMLREAVSETYAHRHDIGLSRARPAISEAVMRIRQLSGILEVREMKKGA